MKTTRAVGGTIAILIAAGCTHHVADADVGAAGNALGQTITCPDGYYDMLDWMTLDADLRGSNRLVSPAHPLYTLVEPDRFWWMKTAQGDTWDENTYDSEYIYFAATEQAWHSPWACKAAVDTTQWKAAHRCVKPGDASDTIVNASSKFRVVSSTEMQQESGDQGTRFHVSDGGSMSWGTLGTLPTLILEYEWNCWDGTCHRLERFFLTQRYGQVSWQYYEEGVLTAQNTSTAMESATVPAKTFACATAPQYRKVSLSSSGAATSGSSSTPSIDDTGRFIAYASVADNLIAGDTNGLSDIFVYDGYWNVTSIRASISSGGAQANGASRAPVISRNGDARYIAFESDASNLVADDTNGTTDVFVHDRWTGETTRMSVGSSGQGNGASYAPSISADGCRIAFASEATNLVAGDTNGSTDVFVRDRCTGQTIRASVSSTGAQILGGFEPSIDDSGRFVAFVSGGNDIVPGDTNGIQDAFLFDSYWNVTTTLLSAGPGGAASNGQTNAPSISGDGRYVAFMSLASNLVPGDTNGTFDVFVRDRWTETTTSASLRPATPGGGIHPKIGPDGRFVAFMSTTNGAWVPWLYDCSTGDSIAPRTLSGALPSNAWAGSVAIGTHAQVVAGASVTDRITLVFESTATDIVSGPDNAGADIFTRTITVP